jgi:hypothetical protein
VCAAEIVGRVLGRLCQRTGLTHLSSCALTVVAEPNAVESENKIDKQLSDDNLDDKHTTKQKNASFEKVCAHFHHVSLSLRSIDSKARYKQKEFV